MTLSEPPPVPYAPAPPPPAKRSPGLFSGSLRLLRQQPGHTMLPLFVVVLPVSVATAVAWFVLLKFAYPDTPVSPESPTWLTDAPASLQMWVYLVSAVAGLFMLVGFAATIVSVNGVLTAKPRTLAESLDPAFTRMGGLLALGAIFYALFTAAVAVAVTVIGALAVPFVILRLGFAFHGYILRERRVLPSLRASWQVSRRRLLGLLGVIGMAVGVAGVSAFIVAIPLAIAGLPLGDNPARAAELAYNAIASVVFTLAMVPSVALFCVASTRYFLDVEKRANG